jgi:hypothetical protein
MEMYLKKQFFIFLLAAAANCTAAAQVTKAVKQQPVADSVAAAMCSCISIQKDSVINRQQLFAILQQCLQKYSVPRMDALLAEDGYVQSDDRKSRAAAIRAVGQKLGQKVSAECVVVKTLVKTFAEDAPPKALH